MTEKVKIRLKSYDVSLIDSTSKKIIELAKEEQASVSGPVPLPTKIEKYTILRSVHVNKKSREQFEIRTHKRMIILSSVNEKLMERLKHLNLSSGIQIETKIG